jgi:hypothetical protein
MNPVNQVNEDIRESKDIPREFIRAEGEVYNRNGKLLYREHIHVRDRAGNIVAIERDGSLQFKGFSYKK